MKDERDQQHQNIGRGHHKWSHLEREGSSSEGYEGDTVQNRAHGHERNETPHSPSLMLEKSDDTGEHEREP